LPKIVDHEQRRREVLDATWRVIDRVGLDEATTRRIAEEAGYSNGVLAHYFTDKDDILVSALELAHSHVRARVAKLTQDRTGLEALRAVIEEALPLDEERLLEARIEFSFVSRALNSQRLRDVREAEVAHFREALCSLVKSARAAGEIDTALTNDEVAGEILVLIDGVSIQALLSPDQVTRGVQLRMLDFLLAGIGGLPAGPAHPASRRPMRRPAKAAGRPSKAAIQKAGTQKTIGPKTIAQRAAGRPGGQ
jgi:AcrR family transcriptional regulator